MAHGQGLHLLHERRLRLSHAAAAALCTLLAGALGALVPAAIRRLPQPAEQDADEQDAEESVAPSYAGGADIPGLAALTAVISGAAGGAVGWRIGPSWLLAGLIPVVPVLVTLAVIDWRTRLLPRIVVLPATGAVLALLGSGVIRFRLRRSPSGVTAVMPGRDPVVLRAGSPVVELHGDPAEVLLWIAGRSAVRVDLQGDPAAVRAVQGMSRRM